MNNFRKLLLFGVFVFFGVVNVSFALTNEDVLTYKTQLSGMSDILSGISSKSYSRLPQLDPCDYVDPICGMDNKTYSSDCEARKVGVDVAYKGRCGACKKEGEHVGGLPKPDYIPSSYGEQCCPGLVRVPVGYNLPPELRPMDLGSVCRTSIPSDAWVPGTPTIMPISPTSTNLMCIQVITPAVNSNNGECKNYPTPCEVPSGWVTVDSCDNSCKKEGENLGAVIPANLNNKCCDGLEPYIPTGILGTMGVCQKSISNATSSSVKTNTKWVTTNEEENSKVTCVDLKMHHFYKMTNKGINNKVSEIQDFLRNLGYLNSESTGYFGLLTTKAVKDFQGANSISQTGYIGPLTIQKIKEVSCM